MSAHLTPTRPAGAAELAPVEIVSLRAARVPSFAGFDPEDYPRRRHSDKDPRDPACSSRYQNDQDDG